MNKISIKHINIILFGFFLLWNFCQPLIIDDLFRSVANSLPNHKLLQTLFSEYHNLTGRMSAQILVHLFFNKELDFYSDYNCFYNKLILSSIRFKLGDFA